MSNIPSKEQTVPAKALKDLYRAYVRLLESGKERIEFHGGTCDSVEQMEKGDPYLIAARVAIQAAEIDAKYAHETPHDWQKLLQRCVDSWRQGNDVAGPMLDAARALASPVETSARPAIDGDLVPEQWWRVHRELANGHTTMALAVVAAVIEGKPLPGCSACDVVKLAINAQNGKGDV